MLDQQLLDSKLFELAEQLRVTNAVEYDTESIKLLFARLFEADDFCCYANRITPPNHTLFYDTNEFLFDFSAVQVSESRHPLIKTVSVLRTFLALETEKGNFKEVVIDFQKLLQSNADEKVMIFRCHSSELEDFTAYLEFDVRNYHIANGVFHFISWLNDKRVFFRRTISLS